MEQNEARPLPLDETFDIELANQLAYYESYNKHYYRPNSYLHKWWARRCGTTFRLLLKHLVEEESARDYYAPGGLEGKVVLDPMIGGGTTLHEALRLGANVVGVDIDPIPIAQARASLRDTPLPRLEEAFTDFYQAVAAQLAPYFQLTCPHCQGEAVWRFTLYARQRRCACGPALFVDSLTLYREKDGQKIIICPSCRTIHRQGRCSPISVIEPPWPLFTKKVKRCGHCQEKYRDDRQRPFYQRYTPFAIAGYCPTHQLFFQVPSQSDLNQIAQADAQRETLSFTHALPIEPGPKADTLHHNGITDYRELFTSRQLLYLQAAINQLAQYEAEVRLPLALLVSTSLEFNALLCGYKGSTQQRAGAIRHVFSYHAYSLPYTALENNPVSPKRSSGTLQKLFYDRIRRGRQWAFQPRERVLRENGRDIIPIKGEQDVGQEIDSPEQLQHGQRRFLLYRRSAEQLPLPDNSVDFVVTDPPYFDSVQYSDLAAFFRVWLAQMLPDEVAGLTWHYQSTDSAVASLADRRKQGLNGQYSQVLGGIFSECQRVLRGEKGRLVFTFHHWQAKGWAALTLTLKQADFFLLNRYVVRAESSVSVHIANFKALIHDAVLILAPSSAKIWSRPTHINQDESATFCQDCATLLGWMLTAELTAEEIEQLWRDYLD